MFFHLDVCYGFWHCFHKFYLIEHSSPSVQFLYNNKKSRLMWIAKWWYHENAFEMRCLFYFVNSESWYKCFATLLFYRFKTLEHCFKAYFIKSYQNILFSIFFNECWIATTNLRYYAPFKVRKFESLFYRINTFFAKKYHLHWRADRAYIICKYTTHIFFQFWAWLFYVIHKSSSFLW